jgi:D-alanyl-D-alanine dipeptidase
MGMKSILRTVLLVSLGACRALSSFGGAVQDSSILQPAEKGRVFRAPALVELVKLDSTIRLDLRYASSNNFMGRPMYGSARAFLQRPAADALVRVHRALRHRGLGLTIFDAYRPWRVTKQFWDETPAAKRAYVADPRRGSIHNRGCAVDLTLCDQRTGKELPMPSPFDDFSLRASPRYGGGTIQERANREILRRAMEAEGFTVNRGEWWHFDYREWREYGILDIPFTAF